MIDPRKVRLMTKLAVYEDGAGKKELKINRYSKKTYVNLKQIQSFVAVTAAYVFLVVLYCFGIYTDIIAAGLRFPWKRYFLGAAAIYLVVFLVNFIVTRWYYSRVYNRAQEHIKKYDRDLCRLRNYLLNVGGQERQSRIDKVEISGKSGKHSKGNGI